MPWPGRLRDCPGDLNRDRLIDQFDLALLLADWGCRGPACLGDLDGDGGTDAFDLAKLLAEWCSVAGGNPCGTCGP